jgi:hypothetical protein
LKNTVKGFAIRFKENSLYLAVVEDVTAGTDSKEYIPCFRLFSVFEWEELVLCEIDSSTYSSVKSVSQSPKAWNVLQ